MSRYRGSGPPEGADDDDANRSRLFGNRTGNSYSSQRGGYAAGSSRSSQGGGYGGAPSGYGSGSGYGTSSGHTQQSHYQGYGQSGTSQPQGYDCEEEEINATKKRIMEVKSKSKTALGNAIDAATKAEGSASATLASLQAQGERLTSTELNLGTASVQNDIAAEKTHELENYNRSMFVPKKMRFFRSRSRVQDEETTIISRNQAEREERDRTREFGYDSKNVVGRGVDTTRRVESKEKSSVAERPQYQFEPKADDDQIEDEIDAGLDELGAITGRLKGIAIASGKVVDRQNEQINRIIKKSDRVDDQIALNQNRLRKIH